MTWASQDPPRAGCRTPLAAAVEKSHQCDRDASPGGGGGCDTETNAPPHFPASPVPPDKTLAGSVGPRCLPLRLVPLGSAPRAGRRQWCGCAADPTRRPPSARTAWWRATKNPRRGRAPGGAPAWPGSSPNQDARRWPSAAVHHRRRGGPAVAGETPDLMKTGEYSQLRGAGAARPVGVSVGGGGGAETGGRRARRLRRSGGGCGWMAGRPRRARQWGAPISSRQVGRLPHVKPQPHLAVHKGPERKKIELFGPPHRPPRAAVGLGRGLPPKSPDATTAAPGGSRAATSAQTGSCGGGAVGPTAQTSRRRSSRHTGWTLATLSVSRLARRRASKERGVWAGGRRLLPPPPTSKDGEWKDDGPPAAAAFERVPPPAQASRPWAKIGAAERGSRRPARRRGRRSVLWRALSRARFSVRPSPATTAGLPSRRRQPRTRDQKEAARPMGRAEDENKGAGGRYVTMASG